MGIEDGSVGVIPSLRVCKLMTPGSTLLLCDLKQFSPKAGRKPSRLIHQVESSAGSNPRVLNVKSLFVYVGSGLLNEVNQ